MSNERDSERQWLARLRLVDRAELLVLLRSVELMTWQEIAIGRELDRRDNLARLVLKG